MIVMLFAPRALKVCRDKPNGKNYQLTR